MQYRLEKKQEMIAGVALELERLRSLDEAIDDLFEELQKRAEASGQKEDLMALLTELSPYFGVIWPSARALAEIMAGFGGQLQGKRVLELGCGLAVPSLVAVKLGAQVTATDFHPEVPVFLERNLKHNHLWENSSFAPQPPSEASTSGFLRFLKLDWTKDLENQSLGAFDYVIGSDILYEQHHPEAVAGLMVRLIQPGSIGFLADPARPYIQNFVDAMRRRGLECTMEVRTVQELPEEAEGSGMAAPARGLPGTKDIFVIRMRRATSL